MNTKPDGFIGSIMAVESIIGSITIIHGPGGCRKNVLSLALKCFPKISPPVDVQNKYFSGYPRMPCTYLEELDYITGSSKHIAEALSMIPLDYYDLAAVVYSPGASLIGDDCSGSIFDTEVNDKLIVLDRTIAFQSVAEGFDHTLVSIINRIKPESQDKIDNSVNLMGITILSKDWESAISDVKELLNCMGIRVLSTPGAAASIDDLKNSARAALNIVLCPEYGMNLAEYYSSEYDIPYYIPKSGAPVGFDAIESFILEVSSIFSVSPDAALDHLSKVRSRAYKCMLAASLRTSTKGKEFAVEGDVSIILPLSKWLYSYLSMIPVSVKINECGHDSMIQELNSFLDSIGCADSLNSDLPEYVDLIACDGNTAKLMKYYGRCSIGLDISFPSIMDIDFVCKPVIGTSGALYLLDAVINS